jgi:hypothetical protein
MRGGIFSSVLAIVLISAGSLAFASFSDTLRCMSGIFSRRSPPQPAYFNVGPDFGILMDQLLPKLIAHIKKYNPGRTDLLEILEQGSKEQWQWWVASHHFPVNLIKRSPLFDHVSSSKSFWMGANGIVNYDDFSIRINSNYPNSLPLEEWKIDANHILSLEGHILDIQSPFGSSSSNFTDNFNTGV